jgi:hypothetical protein
MIARPGLMLGDEPSDHIGRDPTIDLGVLREKTILQIDAEIATEPPVQRHSKTAFLSVQDLGWDQICHSGLEDALQRQSFQPRFGRQREGELDEAMVQQRRSHFETMSHAHPVHLYQQVINQIRIEIQAKYAVEEVGPTAS